MPEKSKKMKKVGKRKRKEKRPVNAHVIDVDNLSSDPEYMGIVDCSWSDDSSMSSDGSEAGEAAAAVAAAGQPPEEPPKQVMTAAEQAYAAPAVAQYAGPPWFDSEDVVVKKAFFTCVCVDSKTPAAQNHIDQALSRSGGGGVAAVAVELRKLGVFLMADAGAASAPARCGDAEPPAVSWDTLAGKLPSKTGLKLGVSECGRGVFTVAKFNPATNGPLLTERCLVAVPRHPLPATRCWACNAGLPASAARCGHCGDRFCPACAKGLAAAAHKEMCPPQLSADRRAKLEQFHDRFGRGRMVDADKAGWPEDGADFDCDFDGTGRAWELALRCAAHAAARHKKAKDFRAALRQARQAAAPAGAAAAVLPARVAAAAALLRAALGSDVPTDDFVAGAVDTAMRAAFADEGDAEVPERQMRGAALFRFGGMFNHACRFPHQNATWSMKGGRLRVSPSEISTISVNAGTEIRLSYLSDAELALPVAARRRLLREGWGFRCTCWPCTSDLKEERGKEGAAAGEEKGGAARPPGGDPAGRASPSAPPRAPEAGSEAKPPPAKQKQKGSAKRKKGAAPESSQTAKKSKVLGKGAGAPIAAAAGSPRVAAKEAPAHAPKEVRMEARKAAPRKEVRKEAPSPAPAPAPAPAPSAKPPPPPAQTWALPPQPRRPLQPIQPRNLPSNAAAAPAPKGRPAGAPPASAGGAAAARKKPPLFAAAPLKRR